MEEIKKKNTKKEIKVEVLVPLIIIKKRKNINKFLLRDLLLLKIEMLDKENKKNLTTEVVQGIIDNLALLS